MLGRMGQMRVTARLVAYVRGWNGRGKPFTMSAINATNAPALDCRSLMKSIVPLAPLGSRAEASSRPRQAWEQSDK